MKNIFLGLATFSMLLTACSKKPISIVVPASEVTTITSNGLVYSLPKTSLKIKVEAKFTSIVPGPYAKFAEKYLGLTGIPVSPSNTWTVTGVNVVSHHHADLQTLFVVEPQEGFNLNFLQLTKEGLVIPALTAEIQSSKQMVQLKPESLSGVEFVDLSATPFIAAEQTTHYTRVLQDSNFVRVPVHKSIVVEKSAEDKAREAADFIFSLRKRRFELLSGDADFVAEGKAAEIVLREISRLESEYLTLFIGKSQTSTATWWFDYSPDGSKKDASTILFRFSEAKGVLPVSDLSGSPVLMSINATDSWTGTEMFEQLAIENKITKPDAIYYRIPVPVQIKVHDSKVDFFSQKLTLYQFGPLVRMPSRFLNVIK